MSFFNSQSCKCGQLSHKHIKRNLGDPNFSCNHLAILELCTFYIDYKNVNSKQLTLVVKSMLNILCRHSFCDFVKIPQKFLPLPMLETITKSTYFHPAKKKIPILWIELQTNKNVKGFKTLHLKTER